MTSPRRDRGRVQRLALPGDGVRGVGAPMGDDLQRPPRAARRCGPTCRDTAARLAAPFRPAPAWRLSVFDLCLDWPATPAPEPVPDAGPDVPVLVLSGRADLRTPLELATRVAATYPRATLLDVPHVGHSVLTSDESRCAVRGLTGLPRWRRARTLHGTARVPRGALPAGVRARDERDHRGATHGRRRAPRPRCDTTRERSVPTVQAQWPARRDGRRDGATRHAPPRGVVPRRARVRQRQQEGQGPRDRHRARRPAHAHAVTSASSITPARRSAAMPSCASSSELNESRISFAPPPST